MIKKIYVTAIVLIFSILPLFSAEFDWGGAFQNTTGISSITNGFITQGNSISLRGELEISPFFKIKAAGGYRFVYSDGEITHIPEFSALTVYGGSNLWSYKVGRFTLSDMNNNLFSSLLDGFQFSIQGRKVKISSGAGFTGLVFSRNSSVLLSMADFKSYSNNSLLASPRIVEYIEASFFILPGDGVLSAAFLAQQDMRAESTFTGDFAGYGLLHTFYLKLGVKGRIGTSLFYNLYLTGETGTYTIPSVAEVAEPVLILAGAGGLRLDLPLNIPAIKPLLSLDLFYSTGDKWGTHSDINQYSSFSLRNKGYIYNAMIGNLFYGDFSISVSPASFLSVSVNSLTMFRAVNGPVSTIPVSEVDSSGSLFLGEEVTLALNFRPFSDLGFQIKGGIFIPNEPVVSDGIQYKVSGFLSLSF